MPTATELKNKGNDALSKGHVSEALNLYTSAIELEPNNHVLFSNRSAAFCKSKEFEKALDDAVACTRINPAWGKGWQRKATALEFQGRFAEAVLAYDEGLKVDKENLTLKEGRKQAMRNANRDEKGFPNMFGFPDLWEKLERHPTTAAMLQTDEEYKAIIERLQEKPNEVVNYVSDERILATLQAMISLEEGTIESGPSGDGDNNNLSKAATPPLKKSPSPVSFRPAPPPAAKKRKSPSPPPPPPAPELSEAKNASLLLKDQANDAYKKKDFEEALKLYQEAFKKDSTNMSIISNMAAVHFEKGEWDLCIAKCEEAVEVGRENRADFKLVAKAMSRAGNANLKKDDHKEALKWFNKSLSEFRAPDVVKKVKQIEKTLADAEAKAYQNPDLAEEERIKGNTVFTAGDFPTAVRHYSEALKRNPEDPKIYSNRAAAYSKLMEFNLALKDCERCIALDPAFLKGYLRMGHICLALKNPQKAAEAFKKAIELDSTNPEALEGFRNANRQADSDPEAVRARAMQDPDVIEILSDPAMQMILEQMQREPESCRDHLRDPAVAGKLKKLMASGILQMR